MEVMWQQTAPTMQENEAMIPMDPLPGMRTPSDPRAAETIRDVEQPPVRSVVIFFGLTFGIAWGLVAVLAAFPGTVEAVFGPVRHSNPLFIIAVWSPALSAVFLVLRYGGWRGLWRFLARVLLWRAPVGWYALLIFGLPAVYFLGAAIDGTLTCEALAQPPMGELLGLVALMLILGPVEEIGWRGYALPLLQRRMAPFWAALVVGGLWALWHIPAFFLSGTPQSGWDLMPFMLGATAVSVILTGFFNAARGSILVAMLFHWQLNMPMWPDAQPWDMLLFVLLAVVATWIKRAAMFNREAAATEVMPTREWLGKSP